MNCDNNLIWFPTEWLIRRETSGSSWRFMKLSVLRMVPHFHLPPTNNFRLISISFRVDCAKTTIWRSRNCTHEDCMNITFSMCYAVIRSITRALFLGAIHTMHAILVASSIRCIYTMFTLHLSLSMCCVLCAVGELFNSTPLLPSTDAIIF